MCIDIIFNQKECKYVKIKNKKKKNYIGLSTTLEPPCGTHLVHVGSKVGNYN